MCDKKGYVNFWGKKPPFLKKLSNVPPKQLFVGFLGKYCFF